jgi:hypothetical protein
MENKIYDILSKIQRWLPAAGAFYLGLCKVWGFGFGSEVNETIVLAAALLAATLEISSGKWYKENEIKIVRKE